MIEENMVDTLLVKVGLPGGGTLGEKIKRLERMGYKVHNAPVLKVINVDTEEEFNNKLAQLENEMDKEDNRHEVEKQIDAIPEGKTIKVDTKPYVAKRGRPKKK